MRRYEDEQILVVVNLSRFAQFAELDLSEFQGAVPVELFGSSEFPPIGDPPYFLTLGPHGFYWFSLEAWPEQADRCSPHRRERPVERGRDRRGAPRVGGAARQLSAAAALVP